MQGGLIAEHWAVRDDLRMMQQLGVLPSPGHEFSGSRCDEVHARQHGTERPPNIATENRTVNSSERRTCACPWSGDLDMYLSAGGVDLG
jgi:hypothetical protein